MSLMNQRELCEAGSVLNEDGTLALHGWARHPFFTYDRGIIAAPLRRIKEWDYYLISAETWALACTVADNGYMGMISVTLINLETATYETDTSIIPFPLGSMNLPASSASGDIRIRHKNKLVDFSVLKDGARIIKLDIPGFSKGRTLRGTIVLQEGPKDESMVTLTPWHNHPQCFFYNEKKNCLMAEGVLRYGTKEILFRKDKSFGTLDWGRGVWPFSSNWYWGSCSTLLEGKRFGLNIGYGFGDTSEATENGIFYDGIIHKLGSVSFHIHPHNYLAPWTFTSDDKRLQMTLEPLVDRSSKMSLLFLSSNQHQVFGHFSGSAVLDDGQTLEFKNIFGFAERVKNKW